MSKLITIALMLTLLETGAVCCLAATPSPTPGPKDKCPVCGMFVQRYPAWAATIRFSDGSQVWFDGTKDLYHYLANLTNYAPNRKPQQIGAILVKDYYSLKQINARTAFYVIGSTVYGPMGHELIPFEQFEAAQEFMKDHQGKRIIRHTDVTPALLKTLE